MSCNNPLKIIRDNRFLYVPCGKCQGCISDKLSQMSARADYEFNHCRFSTFLTLTYDSLYVPISDFAQSYLSNDELISLRKVKNVSHSAFTLRRSHFNTFLDSLTRHYKKLGVSFSFLASGEYGGRFLRPHMHLALYGLDFKSCFPIYSKLWKYGVPYSVPIKSGASRYIMKYLEKQKDSVDFADKHYLERPFITFSKGFGSGLFREHASDISKDGFIHFGSKRVKVSPYYKNKFFSRSTSLDSRQTAIDTYLAELESNARSEHFRDVDSYLDFHAYTNEKNLIEKARSSGSAQPLTFSHRSESCLFNKPDIVENVPIDENSLGISSLF